MTDCNQNDQAQDYNGMLPSPGRRFSERRYEPWYSNDADYNTNAKSYYDFLARFGKILEIIQDVENRLLNRDLSITDTYTIDFTKNGDWKMHCENGCPTYDDVINLQAKVKRSLKTVQKTFDELKDTPFTIKNAITEDTSSMEQGGIWSPDYTDVLNAINNLIGDIKDQISQIINSISVNGKIEVPRNVNITGNGRLANQVDLGNVNDQTRIGITWRVGSTRRTDYYTVGELKTNSAHITGFNMYDDSHGVDYFESFTRVVNGNKLWITTEHNFTQYEDGSISWKGIPWADDNDKTGTVYYDTQNPDYKTATNGQGTINIVRVVVYDLVDPISIN